MIKPCITVVEEPQILVSEWLDLPVYRGVNIALSCQYPWNVDMSMLKAAATQGHQTRTTQLKTAVLMGMHSRWGAFLPKNVTLLHTVPGMQGQAVIVSRLSTSALACCCFC